MQSRGFLNRGARLGISLSGTNLARAADYNQRTVLQAIRVSGEASRSNLAAITGLTAPTIANIAKRLLDAGLIREAGRQQGPRGQPASQLVINPAGGFSIGINIDRDHITIVSLDLAGSVLTRATLEAAFAMPDVVAGWLRRQIADIRASKLIDERRMLGVGVAMPDDLGGVTLPHRPSAYESWNDVDVQAMVEEIVPWPVHIDNDAAAAAIGEAQFGSGMVLSSFFYVLVSAGLGGGLVIDGNYFRGAGARSGEIGFMPDMTRREGRQTVQETVSLSALYAKATRWRVRDRHSRSADPRRRHGGVNCRTLDRGRRAVADRAFDRGQLPDRSRRSADRRASAGDARRCARRAIECHACRLKVAVSGAGRPRDDV